MTFISPGLIEALESTRTESDVRESRVDNLVSMIEVIARGAAQAARARHKCCPFCGSDPLPAALVCGRYVVACEAEDCGADVQVAGASPEEAWKIWDARI